MMQATARVWIHAKDYSVVSVEMPLEVILQVEQTLQNAIAQNMPPPYVLRLSNDEGDVAMVEAMYIEAEHLFPVIMPSKN